MRRLELRFFAKQKHSPRGESRAVPTTAGKSLEGCRERLLALPSENPAADQMGLSGSSWTKQNSLLLPADESRDVRHKFY
jgi:hypothetical protein